MVAAQLLQLQLQLLGQLLLLQLQPRMQLQPMLTM